LRQAWPFEASARIAPEEGCAPAGWSGPWLAHDQPVWLRTDNTPILSLPYALEINDSSTIIGHQASAPEFAEMIVDEFDELLAASRDERLA
jgi:hypothetical protein